MRYIGTLLGSMAFQPGDIVISRASGAEVFELHDAVTGSLVLTSQTLRSALDVAISRGGAVWRSNTDNRGCPLGDAVLLVARGTVR
jgi:hypothetical protein